MALTTNRELDHYVDQELRTVPVAAAAHIYKGGLVGMNSAGYAQPLAGGDPLAGVAYEEGDNTSGANAALSVRVYTVGDFGFPLAGATVADFGRSVYAADDDTLSFDPDGRTLIGTVRDVPQANEVIVRLKSGGPVGVSPISHHTAGFSLTFGQSGTVHTNLGAVGAIVATLPQSPPKGTTFKFVCMADQELRLEPGAAGGIYIKGAKQVDDKYVSVTDIGDFVELIADGNGDWVAVSSISGADVDITVEA